MTLHHTIIYGEHVDDLAVAIRAFCEAGRYDRDGMFVSKVTLAPAVGGPLMRAIMRVEAELLLEDAHTLAVGEPYEQRTPEQRAADAFVRLAQTVGSHLAAGP